MIVAAALAALSGAVALSYEILWYRAFSFASGGSARAFPLLLGAYLAGLAFGAAGARRFCREGSAPPLGPLGAFVVLANVGGFLVIPALAALSARGASWTAALPLVAAAAGGLGAVFPLVSHAAVPPDARAGARVARLYLANIAGSAAGSFVTGFLLLDLWTIRTISTALALAGLAIGAAAFGFRPVRWAATAAAGAALAAAAPALFDGLYEKLQFKGEYRPEMRFAHVVETRSGVITVTPDGRIFGGGIYDGAFNTSLARDVNLIVRAYALAGVHPAPREVLVIGLSSGSWTRVLSRLPGVERVTVVEINPGYLRLVPLFPEVAGILDDPKVTIEIGDGRRWLARRSERRFDLIVSNTTFHWRANATNLLSREFLEIVRSRLKPGGIFFYNTTESDRVQRTGAEAFPHALRIYSCLAVGEAPLRFDRARWLEAMRRYPHDGPPPSEERLREMADRIEANLETRERLLARTRGARPVTDDNMGTEWTWRP
jgi:predicted membrane-bound spermidine synthase